MSFPRRTLAAISLAPALLAAPPARAQLGLGGTAAGMSQGQGGRRVYGPPTTTAVFLYWDVILSGGGGFLFDHLETLPSGQKAAPGGVVFVRAGPQLSFVSHRVLLALRPTYEFSNLSRVTVGADLHFGGLVNDRTYLGLFGGAAFDLDGQLTTDRHGIFPRAGFHTGFSLGPLGFEYLRRSFPREALYGENIGALTLTLSWAFFEGAVGFPPLPGRVFARFHE